MLLAGEAQESREALARRLRKNPALDLVGVARDADEALVLARERHPQVAVLDVASTGSVVSDEAGVPGPSVSPSTQEDRIAIVRRALGDGARGCVVKAGSIEDILEGIWLESLRSTPPAKVGSGPVLDLRHQRERDESRASRTRTERLLSALQGEGLFIVFQPIRHLKSHRVVGYEALARFTAEPQRGPGYWFAEAEALGLGVPLELSAARAACAEIHRLPSGTYLAVNLSPEAASSIELRVLLGDVPHNRLVIEMTEHVPVSNYLHLERTFHDLRWQGVRVAIDDVGAGQSSLRDILELAPDFIKLDTSLTRSIDAQRPRRCLASALTTFAKDIGVEIIAEGIETESELQTLRSLDVCFGQGLHLGAPGSLPDEEPGPPGDGADGLHGLERDSGTELGQSREA